MRLTFPAVSPSVEQSAHFFPPHASHAPSFCVSILIGTFPSAEDADADADADVDADADADTSSGAPASTSAAYRHVRNKYLAVYLLATFGDWIQGGYLYALYAEYGYSRWQNALLNIVGYVSAATNGTYVGALGDVRGHRRNCVLFGIVYAASCALAASSGSVLSLVSSRVLGGLAYSILYTSFESWLNAEAEESNLRPDELASLFSGCTFGSAISAVVAGIIGHVSLSLTWLAQPWSVRSSDGQMPHADHPSQVGILQVGISPMGGENRFAPPFRVAAVALLGVSALAATLWRERWGDGTHASAAGALITSWSHIRRGGILMTLGMVNACYETALYVFVFMWTPALERRAERAMGRAHEMSHGLVFAGFMLCKMAGAQGFAVISARGEAAPEKVLRVVCLGAAACIAVPIFSDNYEVTFLAFCLFEVLLGVRASSQNRYTAKRHSHTTWSLTQPSLSHTHEPTPLHPTPPPPHPFDLDFSSSRSTSLRLPSSARAASTMLSAPPQCPSSAACSTFSSSAYSSSPAR